MPPTRSTAHELTNRTRSALADLSADPQSSSCMLLAAQLGTARDDYTTNPATGKVDPHAAIYNAVEPARERSFVHLTPGASQSPYRHPPPRAL